MPSLKVGAKAPSFALLDQSGTQRTLKSLGADYVVLYFYPKDDTPGCTIEAREFSEHTAAFKKLGAQVIGVSGGDVRSKEKFCSKYDLDLMLLADGDFAVAKKFGVYGKKKFMGREYMGVLRQTFVLDKGGKVLHKFAEVSPQGHAEEVLKFLKSGASATAAPRKARAPKPALRKASKKAAPSTAKPSRAKKMRPKKR